MLLQSLQEIDMGLCNSKPSVAGSPEHYATHTTEQAAPSESPLSSHIEPRRLSTSLEQKRLVYLQRAIDFLRVASKDESRQFVKRLERFHLKETDISTPNLRSQPWGPTL
ncbi:hypothetical protein XarjCFBP8253_02335 [Xanthomonas arboricola pv. juglandis]|nr:hypothetical protein XarjCFBP8253_02335 [Xanthomonas arboricola pv. juglandis]